MHLYKRAPDYSPKKEIFPVKIIIHEEVPFDRNKFLEFCEKEGIQKLDLIIIFNCKDI